MKNRISAILASLLLFTFSNISLAATDNADYKAAQNVIEKFYVALKDKQVDKAAELLAPQLVVMSSRHNFINKDKEIELIKNIDMKDYKLSDFNFSQSGDVIVVTFKNAAAGIHNGKKYPQQAVGRMIVLQKQNDKWLILALANLTVYSE